MGVEQRFPLSPPRDAEPHTIAELVAGREDEFPVLARAALNTVSASNPKIEWTVGGDVWWNYTEIFRARSADRDEARDLLLAKIETALKRGERGIGALSRTLGGYFSYLERDLLDEDVLTLRPLREVFCRQPWRNPPEGSAVVESDDYEWLAEVSLQVVPG